MSSVRVLWSPREALVVIRSKCLRAVHLPLVYHFIVIPDVVRRSEGGSLGTIQASIEHPQFRKQQLLQFTHSITPREASQLISLRPSDFGSWVHFWNRQFRGSLSRGGSRATTLAQKPAGFINHICHSAPKLGLDIIAFAS